MALYCDVVALTGSTAANTDGTAVNITLNSAARRILYFGAQLADATLTAAEARSGVVNVTGPGIDNAPFRFPSGYMMGAGLAPEDSALSDAVWYPVDIPTSPNAVYSFSTRNTASTAAELVNAYAIYSDGEGHPQVSGVWESHGLRGPAKYMVAPDPTSITATTETALTAITVPGNASQVLGFTVAGATNGVKTTAEEFSARARWTATGVRGQFEPSQIWPVLGTLSAGAGAIIDSSPFMVEFYPVSWAVQPNSTMTANVTLRTAVTNATAFRAFVAFR